MNKEEMRIKRRWFALSVRDDINQKIHDERVRLWRIAAKEAKARGLYSKTTYEGDIANGLRRYAE